MNTKLITALRTAASALEHGTFDYSWYSEHSCNNGVLFCALTGQSAAQLKRRVPSDINGKLKAMSWRTIVGQHCPVAGVSTNELLREVMSCGLTQTDIANLELLSDAQVLKRMDAKDVVLLPKKTKRCWPKFWRKAEYGPNLINFKAAKSVIVYMRAWADLLTEEGKLDSVAQEESHVEAGMQNNKQNK